jgi:hypothetical protein
VVRTADRDAAVLLFDDRQRHSNVPKQLTRQRQCSLREPG